MSNAENRDVCVRCQDRGILGIQGFCPRCGKIEACGIGNPVQHQGEPVAWQDPDNESRMCTAEHKAYALSKGGAPAAALATLTRPLYTRADPCEVERLRDELEIVKNNDLKWQGLREQEAEIENLRTQLAERDAIFQKARDDLADWANAYPRARTVDETRQLIDEIDTLLSATEEPKLEPGFYNCTVEDNIPCAVKIGGAEPSAPVEQDDGWKEYQATLTTGGPGPTGRYRVDGKTVTIECTIPTAGQVINTTSAGHDERAKFEEWYCSEARMQPSHPHLSRTDHGYIVALVHHRWEGWQARADLERKQQKTPH